jgi:hypothetical protein
MRLNFVKWIVLCFVMVNSSCDCFSDGERGAGDISICEKDTSSPEPCEREGETTINLNMVADGDKNADHQDTTCVDAVGHLLCGIQAESLASCLHDAAMCFDYLVNKDTLSQAELVKAIRAVVKTSQCAKQLAEWLDCMDIYLNDDDIYEPTSGDDDDDLFDD